MGYPDNFTGTNMDDKYFDVAAHERDMADTDLQHITERKEELVEWLDKTRKTLGEQPALEHPNKPFEAFDLFAAHIEQEFDDFFTKDWHRLTKISGSIEWTAQIPTCEILRAQMARQRKQSQQRQFVRGITNPATLIAKGEL